MFSIFYKIYTNIKTQRIFGLDLLRAIAILAVLLSHTAYFLSPIAAVSLLKNTIDCFIVFVSPLGVLGVELFFVLSGFLVGGILIRNYLITADFGYADVKLFLQRRWWRTLPAYWFILIADIVLYYFMGFGKLEGYKFLYFPFLQNFFSPHPPFFFGEAWSLAVEEWFYLLFPIALFAFAKFFPPKNKEQFLKQFIISFLCCAMLIRVGNALNPAYPDDEDFGIRKIVLFRLDAMVYGVLMAYWQIAKPQSFKFFAKKLLIAGAIGSVLVYGLVAPNIFDASNVQNPTFRFLSDSFLYALIPFVFSLFLPWASSLSTAVNHFGTKVVSYISRVSYSLYLVHYSLLFIPFFSKIEERATTETIILYLLYWLILFTIATLLYRFVEQPFMRYRDRKYKAVN